MNTVIMVFLYEFLVFSALFNNFPGVNFVDELLTFFFQVS